MKSRKHKIIFGNCDGGSGCYHNSETGYYEVWVIAVFILAITPTIVFISSSVFMIYGTIIFISFNIYISD